MLNIMVKYCIFSFRFLYRRVLQCYQLTVLLATLFLQVLMMGAASTVNVTSLIQVL